MSRLLGLLFFAALTTTVFASYRPHFFDQNPSVFNVQPRSVNRLLNTTEPLHYALELTTNIHRQDLTFNGVVRIQFRPREVTNNVRINSYLLTINSCSLFNANNVAIPLNAYSSIDRFLDIFSAAPLEANAIYTLQVSYAGSHRTPSEGFHSSYYVMNGANRYLASTQFQSVFAREAFPCFDEPYYRVPIKLTIRHDPSYNALANAEVESTVAGVTVFKETWQLPSYLIAFVVSDFQCTAKTGKQRICAQPNRMDEVGLAVEASDKILKWMEATFDEEYEQEKLDHIAIPTFQFGGMENWGLVVYHPWYLLFKEGVDTINDKLNVASVISHELAHMYYGNLITNKWWTYLWLSEGLATLYEFYATHAAYPELRMNELFVVNALQSVFRVDATGNTRPMTFYVDSVAGIESIFDSISYLKAGSVFRMIKYAIGEATFHKAMQKYLNENKNSGVDEQPLYAALEAAINEDRTAPLGIMANVMNTWSLQGGYPLVTVQRDYSSNQITISQLEFITQTGAVTSTKLWGIPITFTQKTGANFNKAHADFWFQIRQQAVANDVIANDWVIFNLQQSGYYRVNYDDRNWQQLIDQLTLANHEVFPPTNRAQLIDDINWLADYQKVDNTLRFSLLEYLSRETDMIPLQAARRHVRALNRVFAGSPKYHLFKRYVKKMVESSFNAVEEFSFADEDINTLKSRSVLIDLACMVGMEQCQALTRTLAFAEFKSQAELINKEDREMVYCHGLRSATPKMFELFMKKYDDLYNEEPAPESVLPEGAEDVDYHDYSNINLMSRIMGCYGERKGVEELLTDLFMGSFHYPRHGLQILRSIITNGHIETVLDFMVENIEMSQIEETDFAAALLAISSEAFTNEQTDKLKAILKALEAAGVTIAPEVHANISHNHEWFNYHGTELEEFLTKHYLDDCEKEAPSSAVSYSVSLGVILVALIAKFFD